MQLSVIVILATHATVAVHMTIINVSPYLLQCQLVNLPASMMVTAPCNLLFGRFECDCPSDYSGD